MGNRASHQWDLFKRDPFAYPADQYPKVSVVVPTRNCAEVIPLTVESVLSQKYPAFEVILIDADSTDRTKEVIEGYRDERLRLYSAPAYHVYEMLNKGISLAAGQYINFLFPGDFYLSENTLETVMGFALNQLEPELVYGASLLREREADLRILYRPLDKEYLRLGKQPTSLQSCWFMTRVLKQLGQFRTELSLRGSLDLFCRFVQDPHLRWARIYRVMNDYEYRPITRMNVWSHFKETGEIVWRWYGIWAWIRWLFIQDDLSRFVRLWLRKVRVAFFGRTVS